MKKFIDDLQDEFAMPRYEEVDFLENLTREPTEAEMEALSLGYEEVPADCLPGEHAELDDNDMCIRCGKWFDPESLLND